MKSRALSRVLVPVCLLALMGAMIHLVARPARAAERSPNAPTAFAVGDVFVGVGTGRIKRFTPTGTLLQTLDTQTNCSEDLGMAFDSSGNLYATAAFGCATGTVTKFDVNGTRIGPFGGGYSASTESITLDAAQNVFVGQPDGTRRIRKFDPAGVFLTEYTVAVGPRGTDWIDMSSDQCTLFYTSEGTSIRKFNSCTNTQLADFCTSCPSAAALTGMRIRPNGEIFAADFTGGAVRHYNSSGGLINSYSTAGLANPFAINLDPDGTTFWTADYFPGQVYRFNIATGAKVIDWSGGKLGSAVSGLAVFGEIVVGLPTPTPGGATPTPQGATPTPTPTRANVVVPTLSFPMLGILCAALAVAALLLVRR